MSRAKNFRNKDKTMFLSKDSIKKRKIVHQDSDEFFYDDATKYLFSDITSHYYKEISHYTNSVYQGTSLLFTVTFANTEKPYRIEIDSNKEAKYKTIYLLSFAIATYRAKMLRKAFEEEQEVRFHTLDSFDIVVKNGGMFLEYPNKNPTRIEKILQSHDKRRLEFIAQETKEHIETNSISDKMVFLELCSKVVAVEEKPLNFFQKAMQKITPLATKLYLLYIATFGTAYFLHSFCCEAIPINGWTETGGILLVFTAIMYVLMNFFVVPDEIKKREKEMDNLFKTH
ncbi:MAG: hypothetical protein AABY36_07205 [Campylobacterota bacterium]